MKCSPHLGLQNSREAAISRNMLDCLQRPKNDFCTSLSSSTHPKDDSDLVASHKMTCNLPSICLVHQHTGSIQSNEDHKIQ